MATRPLVYVLVLNYGSLEDTIQCVETLRRLDYPEVRILVIDNASPDGSGEALGRRFGEAEFLPLPTNTGYAGGNNAGIRVALERGAEYVFVVNPDIRVAESTVSRCVELMEGDRTIGAVNPIQLDGDGDRLDEKFREGIFVRHRFAEPAVPIVEERSWDTLTLYGAALMVSRETLGRVGGFDPLFFAYGEEEDLARRIRLKGLRLVVTSAGVVRHLRTKEGRASDFVRPLLENEGSIPLQSEGPDHRLPPVGEKSAQRHGSRPPETASPPVSVQAVPSDPLARAESDDLDRAPSPADLSSPSDGARRAVPHIGPRATPRFTTPPRRGRGRW